MIRRLALRDAMVRPLGGLLAMSFGVRGCVVLLLAIALSNIGFAC